MRSQRLILKRISCTNGATSRRDSSLVHRKKRLFSSIAAVPTNDEDSSSKECSSCVVHSSLSSGLLDYSRGWAWQQSLLSRRLELRRQQAVQGEVQDADCVLVLEHHPVYTLGRGADECHLTFLQDASEERKRLARSNRGEGSARLSVDRRMEMNLQPLPLKEAVNILSDISTPVMAPNNVPIYRVERGGEVTFHGPGQLVVYPQFDLRRPPFSQDLHWYLRMVEQVVILTLQEFGIEGYRDEINTGVWVNGSKVAAVGVTASKWITTHGFALNICPELQYFDTSNILPCGIEGRGVTSMHDIMKQQHQQQQGGETKRPNIKEVASVVLRNLEQVFEIEIQHEVVPLT